MTPETSKRRQAVLAVAVAAFGWCVGGLFLGQAHEDGFGAPLDDSFIYYQYAGRLAQGHFFEYLPGEGFSSGCTSFLWPSLLALMVCLGGQVDQLPEIAVLLGQALLATGASLMFVIGCRLGGLAAGLLCAFLFVASGPIEFGWLGGMEIGLFGTLLLAGVALGFPWSVGTPESAQGQGTAGKGLRRGLAALVWILVSLARPEGALITGAAVALAVGIGLKRQTGLRALLPVAILTPAVAWLAVQHWYTGDAMPATAVAKSYLHRPDATVAGLWDAAWRNWLKLLRALFVDGRPRVALPLAAAWVPLILVGLLRRDTGSVRGLKCSLAAAAVLFLAALSSHDWVTAHYHRYLVPSLPLWILLGVRGVVVLARDIRPILGATLTLLLVIAGWLDFLFARDFYAGCVDDLRNQQEAVGRFLAENTAPSERIAINDAGAIAFRSGRPVFDMIGLVTSGQAQHGVHGPGAVFERLERLPVDERPSYFAVHPGWFQFRGLFGERLMVAAVERLRLLAEKELHVYRADPTVFDSGSRPREGVVRDLPGGTLEYVAELDVADLESEQESDYANPRPDLTVRSQPRRHSHYRSQPDGSGWIADGGRRVVASESFEWQDLGTGSYTLIGRVAGARSDIEIDLGSGAPVTIEVTGGEQFEEFALAVPDAAISHGRLSVQSRPREGGEYFSYHWWLVRAGPEPSGSSDE